MKKPFEKMIPTPKEFEEIAKKQAERARLEINLLTPFAQENNWTAVVETLEYMPVKDLSKVEKEVLKKVIAEFEPIFAQAKEGKIILHSPDFPEAGVEVKLIERALEEVKNSL